MISDQELEQYHEIMHSRPKPAQRTTIWISNRYSLAERDRRWNAVREQGQKAGLDCVFVPTGNGLDARYLTELRNSAVIMPTDGREPIIIADRGAVNEWAPQPRDTGRLWGPSMADALKDLGMERARIGVVGLSAGKFSHVRAPDGVVNHIAFEHVRQQLPNATFVDATDVVGYARYVKGDEEIACLRRAAAFAEVAIDEMIEVAKPGVDAAVLYAKVMEKLLTLGSEYYYLAFYADPIDVGETVRYTSPPVGKRLQANDLITNEVSAVWGGQVAQEDQPILLGKTPDAWKPIIELQREAFEAGLAYMTPGREFGDFIDFINGFGAKRGLRTGTLIHGRGYGDDGPLVTPRDLGDDIRDVRFEKNAVFVWKPQAFSADGKIRFTWGGDVVVTDRGGELLFKRPHGMVTVE
jgi:Xaa-Pro dipeptidase